MWNYFDTFVVGAQLVEFGLKDTAHSRLYRARETIKNIMRNSWSDDDDEYIVCDVEYLMCNVYICLLVYLIWPWAKYPITKSGHRKEIGGGVWTHAGFSKIHINTMKITHSEHSTKFSSPAGGSPPARLT